MKNVVFDWRKMLLIVLIVSLTLVSISVYAEYEVLQKGSKGDNVVALQNRLNELGYSVGKVDGDYGNKTRTAVEQFQTDNGIEATGVADEETQKVLFSLNAKAKANASEDGAKSGIDPEILQAGIDFISDEALEQAAQMWGKSKSSLWVGEVYCVDNGNNEYQFGARVYQDGSGKGVGFGEGITFSKDGKGRWIGEADNIISIYSVTSVIPGDLVWSKTEAYETSSSDQTNESDEASLIAAGMKYISNSVMEIAPTLLGVSKNECRITEIYYLDKGENNYQFTARVSRGGPGGYGIGKALTITPKTGGGWDIADSNHITMYGGTDTIPGELVFGDADVASNAKGLATLFQELRKVDANGDGDLSIDEIFDMN